MYSVRPALPGDASDVATVHVAAWQWAYRGIMPDDLLDGLDVERRRALWERTIARADQAVFVAQEEQRVVGFCHAARHAEDDLGEVYAIYLLEHVTGRGVGRQLMQAAEQALTELECHEAVLWVAAANAPTRRFYEGGGWIHDGSEDTYELPGAGIDVVRYRKRLVGDA